MKKLVSVTLVLLATCFTLWAQDARSNSTNASGRSDAAPAAPTTLVKHVLKGMYNSTSSAPFSLPGFVASPVDGVNSVVCPGASGTCLIQADQWIQLGGGGGTVSICFLVDNVVVGNCILDGMAAVATAMFSVSQGIIVGVGTHTVQTWVSLGGFASSGNYYNFNYKVFKP